MRKLLPLLGSLLITQAAHAVTATDGATVTLNGTFFTGNGGWSLGTNASPQDLIKTDTLPEHQQWNFDSVWWNGAQNPGNSILISLNGLFAIHDLKIQADDNDSYEIAYKKNWADAWSVAWTVPAPGGWGLITSTSSLVSPVAARYLQVTAVSGDGYYAVSRLNAEGKPIREQHSVPDAASTLGLLALGLGSLTALSRFRR